MSDLAGLAPKRALAFLMVLLAGLASSAACDGGPPPGHDAGVIIDDDTFEDHTEKTLATVADFEEIAAASPSSTALKFIITRFQQGGQRALWMDSRFYTLHDEWYWFRLMNGARIDGLGVAPANVGRSFDTVEDIVAWARTQPPDGLPLDLQFVSDGRLYSPNFYQLAIFGDPKILGVGTLLHFRARTDVDPPLAEQWAVELEYQHVLNEVELGFLFSALEPTLPSDVGPRLKLIVRSPQHEELYQELLALGSPLAARFLHYSDVTVPGETEVYSEGLIAGRLRIVRSGESFDDARSTDILVSEDIPDFLPQCAGLITSVPQTALAHVNILAKNRGIPNAYRGGILEDPELDQLARVRAPVIVKAVNPNELEIVAMTETEFAQFRSLSVVPPSAVPPVDLTGVVATYDLSTIDFADGDQWRPVLGGKSTGYLALLSVPDITTTDRPLGISIKPFVDHTASMEPQLQAMLADARFTLEADVRLLVLEGEAAYLLRNPGGAGFVQQFKSERPPGDIVLGVVEAGGVQGLIRDRAIDAATLAEITAALEDHFGGYADEQGLRFRSSSNVEDAEGFNGAGLYTSNTGYLRADRLSGSKAEKTIESAIKETWASYWGFEAFEERRLANVAHLSGAMGCAVHANFQDEFELSNGVMTYTILPSGAAFLEVNSQEGALSVTNPPPGDPNLPEVVRVNLDELGAVSIERIRGSTLLPAGAHVLSDDQLLRVFEETRRVTENWMIVENAALPASQERSTLTIDLEIREVDEGWPMLDNGNAWGSRVVIKQARTLEPSTVRVPELVQSMPIPKDVLARARVVEQRTCDAGALRLTLNEAFTDPLKSPDLGFSKAPFTSFAVIDFAVDIPELSATAGERRSAVHTAFEFAHPGMDAGGPWAVDLIVDASAGFAHVAYDGALTVDSFTAPASCSTLVLFSSPEAFLQSILDR